MRNRERGSAMLMTMVIISALLAGGAVLASVTLTSAHGAEVTRTATAGLHCAESGIVAARETVMLNHALWNGWVGTAMEPAWLAAVNHDLDGDGNADFTITLRDNDDELGANNLGHDLDSTIYIVSTCIKFSDHKAQVAELVHFNGAALERRLWIRLE